MPYAVNTQSFNNASHGISGSAFGDGGIFDFSDSSFTAETLTGTSDAKGGNGGGKKPKPVEDPPTEPTVSYSYTSGSDDESGYNIDIDFFGSEWIVDTGEVDGAGDPILIDLYVAFVDAAEFISSVVMGDRPNYVSANDPNGFFSFDIDDLYITAELIDIDGSGGTLGRAGPTHVIYGSGETSADRLPFAGLMEFDVADAVDFYLENLWDDIVLHEMMHVMGFGTMWDEKNLIETVIEYDLTTKNPFDGTITDYFIGDEASVFVYGDPIVERDGGSGTAGGHWDDAEYGGELMTGYLYPQDYGIGITQMSIASLHDIGYEVDFTAPAYTNLEDDPYAYTMA